MPPLRLAPVFAPIKFNDTFAALRYRNYRLWFTGQLVSLVGTWMQSVAQGYLIYELTKSPAFLGYVGFASGLPSWLFMMYGGVIADRIPRRTMLLITQGFMMLLALVLAALVFTGVVTPWHVILLAFLLGVANAFDAPARMSFAAELVDREDLTNAIALNATMFNTGAVVGPAIGGLIYAAVGPSWCFLFNGLSFVAVMIALLMIRIQPLERTQNRSSALADLKEGIGYVVAHPLIMVLIATVGVVALFGFGLVALIPAWAVEVLKGDVTTNGLLVSARGVGGLIGALMLASFGRSNIRGKAVSAGVVSLPAMFLLFAFVRWVPLSLLLFAIIGFSFILVVNSCNALVQSSLPDHFRGRVMGIYTLVFMGGAPLGSLIAGELAARFGPPAAVLAFASILLVYGAVLTIKRPDLRAVG